jgi:hypothetical protein
VVERATGEPLGGVFVVVLDASGRQVGGVLTDAQGRFRVRVAEAGTYTLRADRIGFEPVASPPLALGAPGVTYRFELESRPIELAGVVAGVDERSCRVRPEEGGRLQAIWEQIRIALGVAAWTARTGPVRSREVAYERWLNPVSGRVREEAVRGRQVFGRAGFAAASPEELVAGGFVREAGEDGGYVFHGLDAATIVSDAFLDAHCFRLRGSPRGQPGLTGLAFEPVAGRAVPGVRGVLWLDEASGELRSLEYTYTWLPWLLPLDPFGGEAWFRRLPGGEWIVERWAIRMPDVERVPPDFTWSRLPGRDILARLRTEAGLLIKEEGGEVAVIHTAAGVRLPGPERAALQGVVHDSIGGGPLAHATVRLLGTDHTAPTDERGRYRMDDLPAGTYAVTFEHPLLDEWDVRPAGAEVELRRGAVTEQDLAVPSPATILALGCPDGDRAAGTAAVVGRVIATGTGEAVGGARVSLRRTGQAPEDALAAWTDAAGVYRFCSVVGEGVARLGAVYLGRSGAETVLEIPGAAPAFHELSLELEAPSRVVGRVIDFETGQPVAGVTLRLAGAPGEGVSGHDGRFVFPDVGPGLHALEARHLAYHTLEDQLGVDGTGRTLQLEVRLAAGAIPLDPIIVTVDRRPMSGMLRAVYDRMDRVRLTGGGTVFGREDIERRNPRDVIHLLSEVHGVQAGMLGDMPILTSTRAFSGFGACMMTVWVDGIMAIRGGVAGLDETLPRRGIDDIIAVSNIEAIEVYHAGGRIPQEYWGSASGCGVVLIWSRRES